MYIYTIILYIYYYSVLTHYTLFFNIYSIYLTLCIYTIYYTLYIYDTDQRAKLGYDLSDTLTKYTTSTSGTTFSSKHQHPLTSHNTTYFTTSTGTNKNKQITIQLFTQIFINYGILIPETAIYTIFTINCQRNNKSVLQVDRFLASLTDALNGVYTHNNDQKTMLIEYDSDGHNSDLFVINILRQYDEYLQVIVKQAFDMFDVYNTNEIPTVELERILHCLGEIVYRYYSVVYYNM